MKVKNKKSPAQPAKNSFILQRLIRLVRSLTQSQKRDFKKYVKFWSGKSDQKYLRLFDALSFYVNSGKEEELLTDYLLNRKKFGDKPADLSALSQYLYRKILESLRTTPEGAPHLARLNALMQDLLFVYNKNLLSDCLPLIEEARELARALDKPAYELELLFWERRARANERIRHRDEYFREYRAEEARLLGEIAAFSRYNALAFELSYLLRGRETLPETVESEVLSLLPEMREGLPNGLSLRAKVRLGSALTTYHELQHTHSTSTDRGLIKMANLEKSLEYQEQVLSAYRANPVFFEEEQAQYALALEGHFNRCLRLGKMEEAERHIAILEQGKNEFLFCRSVAYVRLLHHIRQNEFRQARDFVVRHRLAESIEKHKNRFDEARLLALRFTCGQACFCLDDFGEAGDWFGQVAGMRPDIRTDVAWLCKLLEITCLYEQGVYKKEANPTRPLVNLSRALRRAGLLNEFLEQLIEAVGLVFRNPRALTRDGLPELQAALLVQLNQTQAYYLYAMVLAWLDARLHRSSIGQEILKYNR